MAAHRVMCRHCGTIYTASKVQCSYCEEPNHLWKKKKLRQGWLFDAYPIECAKEVSQ